MTNTFHSLTQLFDFNMVIKLWKVFIPGGPFDVLSRRYLCACSQDLADQLVKIIKQHYPERDWSCSVFTLVSSEQATVCKIAYVIQNYITRTNSCRSWWPCGLRCRSAAAWLLGSRVLIPLRAWMSLVFICCVVLCR
jgi:hypothetical protein